MNKCTFYTVLFIVIVAIFTGTYSSKCFAQKPVMHIDQEVMNLREDIITLNLVNGLQLNDKQLNSYLNILKKLKFLEVELDQKLSVSYKKQLISLNKYKNEMINSGIISNSLQKQTRQQDDELKFLIIAHNNNRVKLEKDLEEIFTVNQRIVINGYIPCLIPPGDIINPSRIGQVKSSDELIDGLTEIRKMNGLIYIIFREFWACKYFEFYENHLKELSSKEKNIEKKRVFKIFDKARNLNHIDFELQKTQLAENITSKFIGEIENFKKSDTHMLGNILLNTAMIPVLEKKISLTYNK